MRVIALKFKAATDVFILLTLVVIVGIVGVTAVYYHVNPINSPKGRSLELATKVAMYTNSLSTLDSGSVKIDTGDNYYDIEMCHLDSKWNIFKQKILSLFREAYKDKEGYYVTVVPYDDEGERLEEQWAAFIVKSYSQEKSCHGNFEKVNGICITKSKDSELAEVKAC